LERSRGVHRDAASLRRSLAAAGDMAGADAARTRPPGRARGLPGHTPSSPARPSATCPPHVPARHVRNTRPRAQHVRCGPRQTTRPRHVPRATHPRHAPAAARRRRACPPRSIYKRSGSDFSATIFAKPMRASSVKQERRLLEYRANASRARGLRPSRSTHSVSMTRRSSSRRGQVLHSCTHLVFRFNI